MTATNTANTKRVVGLMLAILTTLTLALVTLAESQVRAQEAPETQAEPVASATATESATEVPEPAATDAADSEPTDGDAAANAAADGDADAPERPAPAYGRDGLDGLSTELALLGAGIHDMNLDDSQREYVLFTFATDVRDIDDETAFSLQGFAASSIVQAETARLIDDTNQQVLVGFAEGTDLRQYTVATVEPEAVIDRTGQGNRPGSTALQGSTVSAEAGHTGAPDLVTVATDNTLERVRYTFDEELDDRSDTFDAAAFGFATNSGRVVHGAVAVTLNDTDAVVEFEDEVEDAAWFFVASGAVTDRQGKDSTIAGLGDPVTVPQLAAVTRAFGTTQFDFTFDQPVTGVDAGRFTVYSDAGTDYVGESYARVEAHTVRVSFPDIVDFSQEIVLAAVDSGAVTSNDAAEVNNVVGSVALGSNGSQPGFTSGPDLVGFEADATGQVIFRFDEQLDETRDGVDPNGFYVLTGEGDLSPARTVVELDDAWLIVSFDPRLADAAHGYVIAAGTLTDKAGDSNALITVNR